MTAAVATRTIIKQIDDSVGNWLQDLLTGKGDSPSHIIVTAILGVIPGVGQVMDARDIILSIIALTATPANPMAWMDLVINLLGCVPGVGDAFKAVFKLGRIGTPFARILEMLPAKIRGDANRWVREINFPQLGQQVQKASNDTLSGMIHALDSWAAGMVLDRKLLASIIKSLESLKTEANTRIKQAVAELEAIHKRMLQEPLPNSTAQHLPTRTAPPGPASTTKPAPRTQAKPASQTKTINGDKSNNTAAKPFQNKTDTQKQARKRNNWHSGVLPEHLTDYYMPKAKRGYTKINDLGRKREEHDSPKGAGIDHIWYSPLRSPNQPYVVAETKGSLMDSFALLAALPPDIRAKLNALKGEDPFDPSPQPPQTPGKVTVPHDANPDDLKAKRTGRKVEQGLSETKTKGTQMSHAWIIKNIMNTEEKGILQNKKVELNIAINRFTKAKMINPEAPAPYSRWIIMATGKQKTRHEVRHGHHHEIHLPLVDLPNNILDK